MLCVQHWFLYSVPSSRTLTWDLTSRFSVKDMSSYHKPPLPNHENKDFPCFHDLVNRKVEEAVVLTFPIKTVICKYTNSFYILGMQKSIISFYIYSSSLKIIFLLLNCGLMKFENHSKMLHKPFIHLWNPYELNSPQEDAILLLSKQTSTPKVPISAFTRSYSRPSQTNVLYMYWFAHFHTILYTIKKIIIW